jgi:hypothetical protein
LRLIPYLLLLSAAHAAPLVDPVALEHDFLVLPRDPWNLLDHRLTNRRLIEQLETQDFRLLADDDRFALAVDAQTGTPGPPGGGLSRHLARPRPDRPLRHGANHRSP